MLFEKLESNLTEEDKEFFRRVEKSTRIGHDTLNGILEYSQSDKTDVLKKIVSINSCLENALNRLGIFLDSNSVSISRDDFPEMVTVIPIKIQ